MDAIVLHGVKTHNLKNLDLILPHKKFYAVTGVSGSGKSSLALDTLYAEGQRRYVESLSAYARQFLERMEKPDAEAISGIPPAIAIQAKNVITNARSTVGTQTEINDYLRVLFSRAGKTICPDCNIEVNASSPDSAADHLLAHYAEKRVLVLFRLTLGSKKAGALKDFLPELERQGFFDFYSGGQKISSDQILKTKNIGETLQVVADDLTVSAKNRKRLVDSLEQAFRLGRMEAQAALPESKKVLEFSESLKCVSCSKVFREPVPNLFSFNSPLGACPFCQGFGRVITIDWDLVIPDPKKSVIQGVIEPWTKPSSEWEAKELLAFCRKKKIPTDKPWNELTAAQRKLIMEGDRAPGEKWSEGDFFSVKDYFAYLERKTYKMHIRILLSKYRSFVPCTACKETRLKPEALWVKILGQSIYDLQTLSLEKLYAFLEDLKLPKAEHEKVEPVYIEIKKRVRFLKEVGLGYLSLVRLSRTLSGGEVQRIHLATSLGSALVDTLYILDEPSVGLHERDNRMLIRLIYELRDLGNTVVVVEHDKTMIRAADEVIDMGPMGGEGGGRLIFQGKVEALKKNKESLTGQYLSGEREIKRVHTPETKNSKWIEIQGASEHNLKNIDVKIPLGKLVLITGVSGSGKSTLLYEVLYHHFLRFRGRPVQDLGKIKSIKGLENVDEIVLVDQSPIGRTPRSNPATYLKIFDEIRKVFAATREAKQQGFETGHFSFNVDGGRCDTCKGDGRVKVEMHFLADVFVLCEACQGKRFKPEVLEIEYRGKNIDEVLGLTIDDAAIFFQDIKNAAAKLAILQKVGLGYLRLGQSATTLSGGEAQRMKLAYEISEKTANHMLYIFDEPTTGLHDHDIRFLMEAFEELLSRGHSLIVIEHNIDVIQAADYVIDLGPEGGDKGGQVLYQGPLQGLKNCVNSYTAQYVSFAEPKGAKVLSEI